MRERPARPPSAGAPFLSPAARGTASAVAPATALAVALGAVLAVATPAPALAVPGGVSAGIPGGAGHEHAAPASDPALDYFTDVVLVNQDGEPMRLYSDLFAGKVVVINAFFTSCEGVCPVLTERLVAIQEWLGDRLGGDVHMISISVDPATDTPGVVKEYARRFGAKPGWYFLTGEKENVDRALYKLGQYVEDKEAHSPIVLVGNLRTGLWKKVFGLGDPEEFRRAIEQVLNDGA